MEVRWGHILGLGAAILLAVVLAAMALPVRNIASSKNLRPLARVERLTQLPEYMRAVRRHRALLVAATLLVLVTLGCAVYAWARPVAARSSADLDRANDDVMLCVATTATSPASAALFSYYQGQASAYTRQRIGLSSQTLRVIPLTPDHVFAADLLQKFSALAGLSAGAAQGKQLAPDESKLLAAGQEAFSRTVRYSDYQPNFIDTLASCVLGFPDHDQPSGRTRSVVYLGPTDERPAAGTRTVYSPDALAQLVHQAKAQVNIIEVAPGAEPGEPPTGVAKAETEMSGGKFFSFDEASAPGALAPALDQIRANRPAQTEPQSPEPAAHGADDPTLALGLAIGSATLLSLCAAVVRR